VKPLLVLAVVLLLRAPFLRQSIQGDDVYYLAGAEHAQIEPAHPINVHYVFEGDLVDMEGHPHPPLNAWFLGLLLALFGDIREAPFHAAYILFSVVAALSMWSLARRFSPHPLWATLLFLATPAFVINGNTLESDIPFLAFWLAGVALFVSSRYALAAAALALASMAAYQAIVLTPILAVYTWLYARRSKTAWALVLVPPVVIAGWQLYELASIGKLPLAVLAGYFRTYGTQSLAFKLRNAAALPVHFCWLVFPVLLPPAFLISWKRRDADTIFLTAWVAIFFAAGIGIFFAGAARYLLPIAAPVALLVSRLNTRWLAAGFAAQIILSLSLATVNYQHAGGYRSFAESLKPLVARKRVWINGEWGLKYYLEAEGGMPLMREQPVRPGDVVVTSDLGYPVHFSAGGGALTPIAQREIRATLPLRLIALHTRSAYSTVDRGYLPFDISTGPIDRVRAEIVVEREPKLSYVVMTAPEAEQQLVSGVYQDRWMAGRAVILLKSPAVATPLQVKFFIHELAPARRISLLIDGRQVAEKTYDAPGLYTLETPPILPEKPTTTLTIMVDKTFFAAGDRRELGVVLSAAGFP
jgi:Dolichyl-phosphate-mannose-protein mannosyltransferase